MEAHPRIRMRAKLMTLALALTVGVVLAEGVARLWLAVRGESDAYASTEEVRDRVEDGLAEFEPHPYLSYIPTRHFDEGGTRHDSRGFRSEEPAVPKPEGVTRIVALGGSTTYTSNVADNEDAFTYVLEDLLRSEYGYEDVEVLCACSSGYTSWETLVNLATRVLELEPDVVMIYHGFNDVGPRLVWPDTYRSDNSGHRTAWRWPRPSLLEKSLIYRIATSARDRLWTLDSFTMIDDEPDEEPLDLLRENPPTHFRANLEHAFVLSRFRGAQVVTAPFVFSEEPEDYADIEGAVETAIAEHNEVVRTLADQHDVHWVPLDELMPRAGDFWADAIHLNERGAAQKASIYARFLHERVLGSS